MQGDFLRKDKRASVETKRCPYCSTILPLYAKECFACNEKVGPVGKYGLARKPFDWKGYLICLLSFVALGLYIWWAFF